MVNTKTLPGADCGSDHELLMMSMRLKIKKTKAAKHPIRYDMIHLLEQFSVDIKNRFAELIPIVGKYILEKIKITSKWRLGNIFTTQTDRKNMANRRMGVNHGYYAN